MGFEIDRFVCKVSEDRKCALCCLVLDNPVKTPCSHVFCSGCVLPWVVKHGACPFMCQSLNTGELDNVLALRELVLNMKVVCEYKSNGCTKELRLKDLMGHVAECNARPVVCKNKGCGAEILSKDRVLHEVDECEFRLVGVCEQGCDIILSYAEVEKHDCVKSLKARVSQYEGHVQILEKELVELKIKLKSREKELLTKISALQKRYHMQGVKLVNQIRDYESLLADSNSCNNQVCVCSVIFI